MKLINILDEKIYLGNMITQEKKIRLSKALQTSLVQCPKDPMDNNNNYHKKKKMDFPFYKNDQKIIH